MNRYYVALIEFRQQVEESEGKRVVSAMNELKEVGKAIGNVTYYRVMDEKQYRKAEKEFRQQVNR